MRNTKKWLALLLAVSMMSSNFGGIGTKAEAAEPTTVTVEARYSSNRIYWDAVEGATYNVLRGKRIDGEFTTVKSAITATEYVDEEAGTNTRYYYKIEVVKDGEIIATEAVRDAYRTGIAAVQGHAEEEQLHIDFAADTKETGGRIFDNNRVYSILDDTAKDDDAIDRIKNLKEGSIFISYKPKQVGSKATLFTIKNTNVTSGTNNDANDSYATYLNSTSQIRINYTASTYRGNYNFPSSTTDWNTYAVRYGSYKTGDCQMTLIKN